MHSLVKANLKFYNTLTPMKIQKENTTSNVGEFKRILKSAKEVVVLSGAGISAESGVPCYRGKGSRWRGLTAPSLECPGAFRDDPSFVWEFYHYRREMALRAKPNAGHLAIAEYETKHAMDKKFTVLTQNVDGLHTRAGTKNLIELHGSIFKTRCTKCDQVLDNLDSPICEALRGQGSPTSSRHYSTIPVKKLPHCKKPGCGGLLRPHVVWFGEMFPMAIVKQVDPIIWTCNVLLIVGTSSLIYPAAAYPTVMAAAGAIVAEFNVEPKPASIMFDFYFRGPSTKTLRDALTEQSP